MTERTLPKIGTIQRWVIDTMALTGDAVDNVPGVPGIGMKTAQRLMQRYRSLDAILLLALTGHSDDLMTPRLQQLLLRHLNDAIMSRELVWLNDRVPVAWPTGEARL